MKKNKVYSIFLLLPWGNKKRKKSYFSLLLSKAMWTLCLNVTVRQSLFHEQRWKVCVDSSKTEMKKTMFLSSEEQRMKAVNLNYDWWCPKSYSHIQGKTIIYSFLTTIKSEDNISVFLHINYCWLFKAKSFLCIYIRCIISKHFVDTYS